MNEYYQKFYPFQEVINWLSYNDPEMIEKRNFFKVSGQFLNFHELFPPFYIGAIYSHKIMEREYIENFSPIEHEMVFKVDLSSFDNIRSCCSHHNGCEKCWHFIATSLELLSLIIQKNLGFKKNHLL